MILEKIFDVTLNISNPINFCTNKSHYIMTELNNMYANKCFMGTYIIEVIELLQSSSCRIINTNSSGDGIIDVRFSANVFILNTWDVLIGVEIEKNQSLIVGSYKKPELIIDVTFKPTNIQATSLTIGQLIPVRIVKAIHKPRENKIAAAAILLTCDKKATIYRVKGEILKSAIPEIQMLFDMIINELKMREKLNKQTIRFFESLVYSYKHMDKADDKVKVDNTYWEGPKNNESNIVNIFDSINMDLTGFWSRPLHICRSSPLLVVSQTKPTEYVLTAPHLMIIDFAKNILTFLKAIRECCETYTPALITTHENIWNMMRSTQLN